MNSLVIVPLTLISYRHITGPSFQGDFNTQKEAAWSVSNMTVNGTPEQIKYLIDQQAIPAICALLGVRDTQVMYRAGFLLAA